MAQKVPYIVDPQDTSSGRPATFIFLHGYGDEAEGLPLGLAQQFQFASKLPYIRWLLPNAPINRDAQGQAWYMPKALPNAMKPRVPGHEDEETTPDDEEGILQAVETIDKLVEEEIQRGVDGKRIVVGGFSQGCAVSLVWGLVGRMRDKVAGVVGLSGYFPCYERITQLKKERDVVDEGMKNWFFVHGSKDMLVPARLYAEAKKKLGEFVAEGVIEEHLYEGMGHSTSAKELRDLLGWMERIVPP